ncbi:MAG: HAD hydrolase-like protein [Methanoregula sp.]|nr:HAD hydrolase-like protein [Methanoregula sp.]
MQPPPFLVFDLDGTLSDPAPGICRCLNYSLTSFGYPGLTEREVSQYIGPPLDFGFRQITGETADERIAEMVARYRERYGRIGYAENTLYPGIREAIRDLSDRQIPLGICTSKRADFAEKILGMFHLREYFSFVSGGDIGIVKEDQLRGLLQDTTIDRRTAIMIGDRAVDILAARANGLASVGVLWGYGSKKELQEAAPEKILETPEHIKDLVGGSRPVS